MWCVEYIWIDNDGNLRGKTKIMSGSNDCNYRCKSDGESILKNLPIWNYDGSSTGQATTENSEVLIKPIRVIDDPFNRSETGDVHYYIALCETLNINEKPHSTNTRSKALKIFSQKSDHIKPLFGIEQEFFISRMVAGNLLPVGFSSNNFMPRPQGDYYCGVGGNNIYSRNIIEELRDNLLYSCIPITGGKC